MNYTLLIIFWALVLYVILGMFLYYFKSEYVVFRELSRTFAGTANIMIKLIEDDKMNEDEFKDLAKHLKAINIKAQKLLK